MYKASYLHGNFGGNKIANTTGQFSGLEIDALPPAILLAHITVFKRYAPTHTRAKAIPFNGRIGEIYVRNFSFGCYF